MSWGGKGLMLNADAACRDLLGSGRRSADGSIQTAGGVLGKGESSTARTRDPRFQCTGTFPRCRRPRTHSADQGYDKGCDEDERHQQYVARAIELDQLHAQALEMVGVLSIYFHYFQVVTRLKLMYILSNQSPPMATAPHTIPTPGAVSSCQKQRGSPTLGSRQRVTAQSPSWFQVPASSSMRCCVSNGGSPARGSTRS